MSTKKWTVEIGRKRRAGIQVVYSAVRSQTTGKNREWCKRIEENVRKMMDSRPILKDARFESLHDQLSAGMDLEFVVHMLRVVEDGIVAQAKLGCNLAIIKTIFD